MANTIAEMLQELGYYQSGGVPQGQRDIDKVNAISDTIGKGFKGYQEAENLNTQRSKMELEMRKLAQDAIASENLNKPRSEYLQEGQIKPETPVRVGQELASTMATEALAKQRATPKVNSKVQSALLSGYITKDAIKELFPNVPEDKLTSISVAMVDDENKMKRAVQMSAYRPLSPEVVKLKSNADDGIISIDRALDIMERKPEIFRKAGLPYGLNRVASIGDTDAQNFARDVMNASDVITRLRTGAALNQEEEKYYGKLLNDILATPEVAEQNLEKVRDFFNTIKQDIAAGRRIYNPDGGPANPPPGKPTGTSAKTPPKVGETFNGSKVKSVRKVR